MWPFTAATTPPPQSATDAGLRDRVADLERQVQALEIEWSEWFDKYRRLYARIAKRAERDEKEEGKSRDVAPGSKNGAGEGVDIPSRIHRNLRGF